MDPETVLAGNTKALPRKIVSGGQTGVDRVALGSDYPFPLGEAEPGALIGTVEAFTDAQRRQLLGGTAREFLAL